jgi:DNA-binding CsgD family transcriptional regulator
MDAPLPRKPSQHSSQNALSKREQEVLDELRNGGRVATIAHKLSISPTTVRNHLQRIFWKLGVHSQAELVEHVRRHPETLSDVDAETRYWQANQRLGAEIDELIDQRWGPEVFHEIVHRALPLSDAGREEWLARLAIWTRGDAAGSEISLKRIAEMELWRSQAEKRIVKAQEEGWLRSDTTPSEILEQLFSLLVGVSFQLVADLDPKRKTSQVRVVDAYIENFLVDDERATDRRAPTSDQG